MLKILLKIHTYFYSQKKIKYLLFIFLGLISTIFESFGYLSIVPLISILINPDILQSSTFLKFLNSIIKSSDQHEFITKYGIFCISLFIFGSIFNFIQTSLQIKFVNSIILNTRQKLLENYINKDFTFHKNNNTTDLVSKLFTQIDEMGQTVLFGFFELCNSIFLILIFTLLLFFVSWKLTLAALLFLLFFYLLIELKLKKRIKIVAEILYFSNLKALAFATETIKLFKEIAFDKQEKFFLDRFKNEISKIYNARNFVRIIPRLTRFLIETLVIGSIILLVLLIYIKEKNINNFIEIIILFSLSIYKIFPNLNKLFQININIKSCYNQLFNILSDSENIKKKKFLKINNNFFNQYIKLKNVNFSYGKKQILKKINLTINKNKTILIYGKSGSGKSTICDIISGRLKPSKGTILIDGKNINLSQYDNIKKYYAYIGPEPLIINHNFYTNISLEKKCDKKKVKKCAKIAQIDNFIQNKKNKYNYIVTENGKNLSGGQKQRLSIARALYLESEILIIDEATSNIDITTEKKIYNNMFLNEYLSKTKIIISHHPNKSIKYDYYYKIEDGKIIYHGYKLIN